MKDVKRTLPEFDNPPVTETVLGVQFAPLKELSTLHLGIYWSKIRRSYPNYAVQPALAHEIEQFESHKQIQGAEVAVSFKAEPDIRFWFINSPRTHLLQVQRDRFILNWRKVTGTEPYPRYDRNKPQFKDDWEGFLRFLEDEKLGQPEVNQCEVTYVNHIDMGIGWKSFGEANKVVTCLTSPKGLLSNPEMVRLDTRYVIEENRGRLYISFEPTLRRKHAKETLQLNLTARGRPDSSRTEDILNWFDLGHEWIVKAFAEFTTEAMHDIWGRRV